MLHLTLELDPENNRGLFFLSVPVPGGSYPAVGGPGLCSHDQIQGPGKEASKAGRGLSDETEDTEFRHFKVHLPGAMGFGASVFLKL